MRPLIALGKRTTLYACLLQLGVLAAFAQTPSSVARCQVSSSPVPVRAEGLTERLGDITLQCSGASAGSVFSGYLILTLSVTVTNRVDDNNQATDVVVYVDLGSGEVPTGIAGQVSGNSISFNGISYTAPPSGKINLRISGIRAAMNQLGLTSAVPAQVTAYLSTQLAVDQSQLVLAYSQAGLYSSIASTGITCYGSPVPDTLDMPSLFAAGTALASTRVSEGFGTAFEAHTAGTDSGTRFLVKYTGVPAAAHLYLPDTVAGSDALIPTSGGDMNLPQSAGSYQPGSGALLLVRVVGADATGAGGYPMIVLTGTFQPMLNSVTEVPIADGSGYAVYEVGAANPNARETAQFPTFIVLPRSTPPTVAQETVSLAPVSTVTTASATAPVPRFAAVPMQSDCQLFGDCTPAPVVSNPKLLVEAPTIMLSAVGEGGAMTSSAGTILIHNTGNGSMPWTTSIVYTKGSGWLTLNPAFGTNEATMLVTAQTTTLSAGLYFATIIVNAGSAGANTVFVYLAVTAPPPVTPSVVVSQVLNAATLQVAPLVAGSLATLMGSHLSGTRVAVTFDSLPATLVYTSDTQINLRVPSALGSTGSTTLVVTVDSVSSTPQAVPLAVAWPAVFPHGILNQNNAENTPSAAAKSGDILQIFATGIPTLATVSVQIGDRKDLVPVYAGDAPTCPGVQQVNVAVPAGVTGTPAVEVCATVGGQQYCSAAYSITVQ